jgi:hypothetical protein
MICENPSPRRLEQILVRFFGLISTYIQVLIDDTESRSDIEEFWLTTWSEWQSVSGIADKLQEFYLLNPPMESAIRGVFMHEMLSSDQASESRQAIVAIASSQGTASVLPMTMTIFFRYIFDVAEREGLPLLQRVFDEFLCKALAED